jgi:uncharacterized protein YdhG (YjbR/CyaY superfamily)
LGSKYSDYMQLPADNPDHYVTQIPEERQAIFNELRIIIKNNMPPELQECISYGMIGYVVPKSVYPAGYHCSPELPLPFANLASQKNNISFYHMGLYANEDLMLWFKEEYAKRSKYKLDMGKSCVRFKRMDDIPVELIGELMGRISTQEWVDTYERIYKK